MTEQKLPLRCRRCGHTWIPRKLEKGKLVPPKVCPVCKRTDWNQAR